MWAVPRGLVALYLDQRGSHDRTTPVQIEHLARTAVDALLAVPAQDVVADWAV
jgi:hypothetical protein